MWSSGGLPGSIRYAMAMGKNRYYTADIYDPNGVPVDEKCLRKKPFTPIKDPSYLEMVRIALCYYIAKIDGVSADEQRIIDEMCQNLLENGCGGAQFRSDLKMILADKSRCFDTVKRYINRVEPEVLEDFMQDIVAMAETTDGITDNERKAIGEFRAFIDERKGMSDEQVNSTSVGQEEL